MSLRYLSISQLSEITGKDRRTISKRLAGIKPQSINGRAHLYDAAEAIETIFVSDSVEGMDKKLLRVQLGFETARQQKAEIEVAKLRGELVPLDDVAKAVEKEYAFVRSQFRSLPSKLAKPLSMVTDPNEVHTRLLEAVDECLAELTADTRYEQARLELDASGSAFGTESEADARALTETESGGVGGSVPVPEPGVQQHSRPLEDRKRRSRTRPDVSGDGLAGEEDHSDGSDAASEDGADQ